MPAHSTQSDQQIIRYKNTRSQRTSERKLITTSTRTSPGEKRQPTRHYRWKHQDERCRGAAQTAHPTSIMLKMPQSLTLTEIQYLILVLLSRNKMPPKTPRTPERPSGQSDIRRFTSPTHPPEESVAASTPQRRRRIIDSDSEAEQPYSRREPVATQHGNANSAAPPARNQQLNDDAIEVSSGGEACQHGHSPTASDSSDNMYIMGTAPRQQSSRQAQTPQRRSATRTTVQCEADESSIAIDDTTPDESDDNAADMYRSSILGIRNRTNAMQQV